MNEKDFDILDNSLTLRNLTKEQKKSVARLMELAIEEAREKWQAFQQSVYLTALGRGRREGFLVGVIVSAIVVYAAIGGR